MLMFMFFSFFSQGLYIHVEAFEVVWLKCRCGDATHCTRNLHGATAWVCDSVCLKYSCAFSKALQFLRPLSHSVGTAQFNIALLHTIDRPKSSECKERTKEAGSMSSHLHNTGNRRRKKVRGKKNNHKTKHWHRQIFPIHSDVNSAEREKEREGSFLQT